MYVHVYINLINVFLYDVHWYFDYYLLLQMLEMIVEDNYFEYEFQNLHDIRSLYIYYIEPK